MASFANRQGITQIKFTQDIQCFCPLGNDWYTNHVTVEFEPTSIIPDYCEIDDFTRSLGGESLIIEDVVNTIYDYMNKSYQPNMLRVTSYVDDAKHMPVTVVKE